MEFTVKRFKYEVFSSSVQSKTAAILENWITITFFKVKMQDSIS